MIIVVSLGVEEGDWSARAREAILSADRVLVRTEQTVSANALKRTGVVYESLDFVYEKSRSFDTLTKNLAQEVVRRSEGVNLCYCVDGGVCEDGAAQLLLKRKGVTAIEGVTKGAYCAAKANLGGGALSLSAYEVGERELTLPLVVYDIDSRDLCSDVKLALAEQFGDEAEAYLLHRGEGKKIPLYEADWGEEYDYSTMLAVYAQPLLEKKRFSFADFVSILKRLRAPDGCPWDRVQTHESIRINLIEEAYELVDAIDLKDGEKMREECGDVLMQAIFHTLIEEERGGFTVTDMLTEVCEKLITRHTHVFGNDKAKGADGALSVWDKNKMTEKGQNSFSDAVNDVPEGFPALLRAQKVLKRMEKGGLLLGSYEALQEQIRTLAATGDFYACSGELLMSLTAILRKAGVECEQALLDTVKKYQAIYTAFEGKALADGKDVNALSEEEREQYFNEAKNEVAGA